MDNQSQSPKACFYTLKKQKCVCDNLLLKSNGACRSVLVQGLTVCLLSVLRPITFARPPRCTRKSGGLEVEERQGGPECRGHSPATFSCNGYYADNKKPASLTHGAGLKVMNRNTLFTLTVSSHQLFFDFLVF